jgi:LmbE family N-acetylglucosaminyl deacetylase
MIILLIIVLIIPLLWLAGFLLVTDFAVPVKDARQFQHVLAIFPHADDEAVTCGGSLHRFAKGGSKVTLALLTKGEKGTPNATRDISLKEVRTKEAQAAAAILGITDLVQEDFGDGALHAKKPELRAFIAALIEQTEPDLLITYDRTGLYGHSDHITCAEIVTELQQTLFQTIPLWYVTLPKRVLARVKLPDQLTTTSHTQAKRASATHKLFIGASVFPKIAAWYTYKSQRASQKEGIRKVLPIWFFLSMVLFEYFAGEGRR